MRLGVPAAEPGRLSGLRHSGAVESLKLVVARKLVLFACLLVSACGGRLEYPEQERDATLDQVLTPVPPAFRKVWAVNLEDCAIPGGKTRISIDPASVSFAEGRFDVLSINQPDEDNLLLDVRLGAGPLQTHVLHLGEAMSTLNYAGPGILQTYQRCGR